MPYAVDEHGSPIFFVSTLAMHTQNLRGDQHASLFVSDPAVLGDPLASARINLIGMVQQAPAPEVSPIYLARHENAKQWRDFSDFSYYRMAVAHVYFIEGFGVMDWISAEDYRAACPAI